MFEPIGGSAPKYTGLHKVNPIAAIAAAQMMLDYLGETKVAQAIEDGIKKTATMMDSMGAGRMGYTTTEVGDLVAKHAVEALK
jgi:3-isopropylmalate dehydrogenase